MKELGQEEQGVKIKRRRGNGEVEKNTGDFVVSTGSALALIFVNFQVLKYNQHVCLQSANLNTTLIISPRISVDHKYSERDAEKNRGTGGEGWRVSQSVPDNGPTLILCPDDLSNENTIVKPLLIASLHFSPS